MFWREKVSFGAKTKHSCYERQREKGECKRLDDRRRRERESCVVAGECGSGEERGERGEKKRREKSER